MNRLHCGVAVIHKVSSTVVLDAALSVRTGSQHIGDLVMIEDAGKTEVFQLFQRTNLCGVAKVSTVIEHAFKLRIRRDRLELVPREFITGRLFPLCLGKLALFGRHPVRFFLGIRSAVQCVIAFLLKSMRQGRKFGY